MFFLRALGAALGQLDRMSMSEAALLKQVRRECCAWPGTDLT